MRNDFGILILACALVVAPMGLNVAASGPSGGTTGGSPEGTISAEFRNATEAAKAKYYSGLRLVRQAQAYDAEASNASTPEKSAKAHQNAQNDYRQSIAPFIDTVIAFPKLYQAWSYLGFANLRLGNYEDSLAAYSKALEINPSDPEAIARRAEACLGLDMIDEARSAYELLGSSPKSADELMSAMRRWADAHRQGAQDLSAGEVDAFTKWVDQRTVNAAQVN
jgi:tetratricopeptide (TPR) repeat protein